MTQKTPSLQDAEGYVGRAYVEGEFDCASLAVLVQRELFGREIDLPAAGQRARGRRGQARDIQTMQPGLADPVTAPETGDAVILWAATTDGTPPFNRQWHVGTVFLHAGETWVLHCANESQGVSLQRLDPLLRGGLHLDGFYRWRAAAPKLDLAIAARPLSGHVETRQTLAGRTLAETLAAEGISGSGWLVSVGGHSVPPAMWSRTRVKPGHLIEAHAVVRKQALALIAVVALTYFTSGIGGGAASGLLGSSFAAGTIGAAALAGAVYVGGSMLINKLLSPKTSSAGDNTGGQPSPTYALQGGRNRARPYEPLSLVLGETKAIPDNANQPFAWFEGDDQFLATMFHAGVNCGSVSDIKIGDTAVESYEGTVISRYGFPDGNSGQPPILGNSVDTVAGALLDAPTAPGPWVSRTTSVDTVQIAIDLEMQLSALNAKGEYQPANVQVEAQYRAVGSPDWQALAAPVYTSVSAKPLRRTITFDLPAGQYEIRVRKANEANYTIPGFSNVVSWTTLKSYQADYANYGGQPRVNLQLKASGQLSGAPDEVNWIARGAPMPYWNGGAWVTATEAGATGVSNPGAQILMLLRGIYRSSDGRLIAGAGLSDSRIDIESLKGFMVRCAAKGYRFDAMIQEAMNLQDLLESIAAVGLGSLSRHSGRIGVVWMAEDQPIEGVINMASMKARSFGVQYDLVATADEYQLEFFDRDRSWTWQPVRVQAPGTITPQRTSTENVRGVTRADHAAVMARFAMGQNIYGRKSITFEMDLEHLVYRRGSVLSLSHDLTQWGYGGRVVGVATAGGQFTVEVDEPVPTTVQATRTLGLRLAGEQQMRIFNVASISSDGRVLTVGQAWPGGAIVPGVETPAHDALWIYDFKSTPGYRVRITSIEPVDNMAGAQITVVPESPEFWNYVLFGNYVPPPNNSLLAQDLPVASNLRITRARIRQGDGWAHELTATWDVIGRYDHAQVWAAPQGTDLQMIGETFGTQFSWVVPQDQIWAVEVRPFDPLGRAGTKVSTVFSDSTVPVAPVSDLSITVALTGILAQWKAPEGLDAIGWALTQLRKGDVYDTAVPVFEGRADRVLLQWLLAGVHKYWAAHKSTSGDWSSPQSASITVLVPKQPIPSAVTNRAGQVSLLWDDCRTTQPIDFYDIRIGDTWETAVALAQARGTSFETKQTQFGEKRYWVQAVDAAGNRGAQGYAVALTLSTYDSEIGSIRGTVNQSLDELAALQMQGELTADGKLNAVRAGVYQQIEVVKTATTALATKYDAVSATVGEYQALVSTKISTMADLQSAQALQTTVIAAVTAQNTAAIVDEVSARTTAVSAVATQVTTVQSSVSTLSGTVQTQSNTLANLNGNVAAQYMVRTEVMTAAGKRAMAGLSLGVSATGSGTTTQSEAIVFADRFIVVADASSTVLDAPFRVEGGVVYINVAKIKNADIDTLKVAGYALTVSLAASGAGTASLSFTVPTGQIWRAVARADAGNGPVIEGTYLSHYIATLALTGAGNRTAQSVLVGIAEGEAGSTSYYQSPGLSNQSVIDYPAGARTITATWSGATGPIGSTPDVLLVVDLHKRGA